MDAARFAEHEAKLLAKKSEDARLIMRDIFRKVDRKEINKEVIKKEIDKYNKAMARGRITEALTIAGNLGHKYLGRDTR